NDVWEFDGTQWTDVTPATRAPDARDLVAMAYDPLRALVVMHGGRNDTTIFDDTWEWNGTDWSAPSIGPYAVSAAMAFDSSSGRVVLFGGDYNDGVTRAWTGSGWLDLPLGAKNPLPRSAHAMALDPVRGKVVLFGGTGMGN